MKTLHLDRLIAEHLFGWTDLQERQRHVFPLVGRRPNGTLGTVPRYASSWDSIKPLVLASGSPCDTAPEAVARAALAALGVEVEG